MLLESGQKAYNDKNFTLAANQLREFLKKHGGHKEAPATRYSLALTLIHGPEKNYNEALQNLQPIAGQKESADHPFVVYYLGLSRRGLGIQELAQAKTKPQESAQRTQAAQQHFAQAAQDFATALAVFEDRVKKGGDDKDLAKLQDWSARVRCELAEMHLRTNKLEDARKTAVLFVKDAPWNKSQYRPTALYYHGFACFLLNDPLEAGRSLNLPAVLNHPVFGTHARYLLARVHHLQDERAEAAEQYESVLAEFAKHKKAAQDALKNPALFKDDPEEKSRLETLANGPLPDHVGRAQFYLAVLRYEDGQFNDAAVKLSEFLKQFPNASLSAPAQLRLGFTQVQLKQFAEALKTLSPLTQHPQFSDQALFWTAKAQVGAADPANTQAYGQALGTAINTLNQAAGKANELAQKDPQAKLRRGEILLELADTMMLAKQFKEAAAVCQQIRTDKLLPKREEEVVQRQATALHLAGDYTGSDQVCVQFQQAFPKSTLLPAVLFRHAENAYFLSLAAEKNPNAAEKAKEVAKWNDEVIKRYQAVITQSPEFAHVPLARFGAAMGHYRKGDLEKAQKLLDAIPVPDRQGQLALVPYLIADCHLRLAPADADDALAAGMLHEKLKSAIELLDAFTAAQPKLAETPDALIRLGLCQQKMAKLVADPQEKTKRLNDARTIYEKVLKDFAQHPLAPQAHLERAKCLALAGNPNGAIDELKKFSADPWQKSPVAAMGLLELATLYRSQKKAKEAADVLAQARQQHEGTLQADPARAGWIDLLRYHHGLVLQELNKQAEARALFEMVVKKSPGTPFAVQAALGYGQCLRQEGMQTIEDVKKKLATPNLPPQQLEEAKKQREDAIKKLRDAATYLEERAADFKKNPGDKKDLCRMYYEAAWSWRGVADFEIAGIRAKLQDEAKKKLEAELAKKTPAGKTPPPAVAPTIALKAIPPQPAEQKARAVYQTLIKDYADLTLASHARLELAELLADREEFDPAIQLLGAAFENELPEDLADQIRIRLGMCQLFKGQPQEGLKQFKLVADNPKSMQSAQGTYYAGEALFQLKEWEGVTKYLAKFRDHGPFQNLAGVADRGLLRLGHAYAQMQKWEESKQAHELVWQRFPASAWANEAKYGAAWALQNQKQHDPAVALYEQVIAGTLEEIAAKSQLQIGLCRHDQKRYPEALAALLVVPYSYDYPDWSGAALFEAHRVFLDMKNQPQAVLLLQRIVADYPGSQWAKLAQKELGKLKDGKAAQ